MSSRRCFNNTSNCFPWSSAVAGVIVAPAFEALEAFAHEDGIPVEPREALIESPVVRKLYRREIDRLTTHLADFEKLRVVLLTTREFSIEKGELTPTLKVKRGAVLDSMADRVKAAYSGRS